MSVFAFAGPEHEFANGFSGIFALLKDEFHLLGDGHLDTAFASELEGGSGGENTFSHLSAETLEDFGELAAFTERLTNGSVSREGTGAGQDEVAYSTETGEGLRIASAGDSEPCHFGDATGDERGSGVMAQADAHSDAGSDGDDVFESAAEFHPDDIAGCVQA